MMKTTVTLLLFFWCACGSAQKVIPLYPGSVPGSENWNWEEAEMQSDLWQTRVVYNVSKPTLVAYFPPVTNINGTAVLICPGGAFHALSIDSEGIDVARRLNSMGVTAFVLKYRLVKSETSDPVREVSTKMAQGEKFHADNARVIPLAIADGIEAIRYLRTHAADLRINPDRIGIMGFSAGGTVAAGVTFQGVDETRPDFVASVYTYLTPSLKQLDAPQDAPPLFIAAASDDQLGLAPHSVMLYEKWMDARKPVEMHLYERGGHGFGMRTQNLPSDSWIERFSNWLEIQGLLLPADPNDPHRILTPQEIHERRNAGRARLQSDWANLERYKEDNERLGPPKPGETRIVFMGNSITSRWLTAHPEFFAGKSYINRGIGGQTTPQMLLRFKQDVIDLKPKVVVILGGINDIAQLTQAFDPDVIVDNLSGMALLARAHGIEVILSSVLPAYDFRSRPGTEPAEKVIALNRRIREFAARNKFYYLDYFQALVDSRNGLRKEYATDEVHPNLEGYKVMEPLVEKAIRAVLKKR